MFVDFIHNWNLTSVINKLQQSSISSPDVSSKFKVNPQTLVNFSIPPYSKNEKIITDQSSIHPFKIRPNNYLNMSQCNLIVKKLMLRPKFKKSKQNISFFHKKRFSHLKTKKVISMGKTISDKKLGSLHSFLKHEKDPWGIKDLNSRYVYVNNFSHLGIKLDFNIEGILDSELPHPVAELSSDLIIHDNNVIFNDKKEAVIQTSFNFKEKRLKPYFFEKRPFYNEFGEIIGTIYHGRELANLCINIAHPSVYLFTPPNDLFSNRELDIVFLAQQKLNSKEIAKCLNIAIQTVEVHLKSIYKKVDVHCLRQFIEYCKSTGFDRYIPQKFLKNEIKFVK